MKFYQIGNIEKFSKEVFLDQHLFFAKKNDPRSFLSIQFFMYCKVIRVIRKKFSIFFFQNLLTFFERKKVLDIVTYLQKKNVGYEKQVLQQLFQLMHEQLCMVVDTR